MGTINTCDQWLQSIGLINIIMINEDDCWVQLLVAIKRYDLWKFNKVHALGTIEGCDYNQWVQLTVISFIYLACYVEAIFLGVTMNKSFLSIPYIISTPHSTPWFVISCRRFWPPIRSQEKSGKIIVEKTVLKGGGDGSMFPISKSFSLPCLIDMFHVLCPAR